jgi:hypothetical protein
MGRYWDHIKQSLKRKDDNIVKSDFKIRTPMTKNVYEPAGTPIGDYLKRHNSVHYFFKYKFFIPALYLAKKFFKKSIVRKVPNEDFNRNLMIFDESFKKSVEEWTLLYQMGGQDKKVYTEKEKSDFLKSQMVSEFGSQKNLLDMKDMLITVLLYDTAYKEFFNIFSHNFSRQMTDYYCKNHPKGVGHLFYNDTDIYDLSYFYLFKQVEIKAGIVDSVTHIPVKLNMDELKKNESESLKLREVK